MELTMIDKKFNVNILDWWKFIKIWQREEINLLMSQTISIIEI